MRYTCMRALGGAGRDARAFSILMPLAVCFATVLQKQNGKHQQSSQNVQADTRPTTSTTWYSTIGLITLRKASLKISEAKHRYLHITILPLFYYFEIGEAWRE